MIDLNGSQHPAPSRSTRRSRVPDWSSSRKRRHPQRLRPITELLEARDRALELAASAPTPVNRDKAWAASEALAEARLAAAKAFGAAYGWTVARHGFRPVKLSHGSGSSADFQAPYPLFDHPICFRWPDGWHSAAAIVSQPYSLAFKIDEAEAFASRHGLSVHVDRETESWYSPGKCLVVIWT
jgi:hypothetical protein